MEIVLFGRIVIIDFISTGLAVLFLIMVASNLFLVFKKHYISGALAIFAAFSVIIIYLEMITIGTWVAILTLFLVMVNTILAVLVSILSMLLPKNSYPKKRKRDFAITLSSYYVSLILLILTYIFS